MVAMQDCIECDPYPSGVASAFSMVHGSVVESGLPSHDIVR